MARSRLVVVSVTEAGQQRGDLIGKVQRHAAVALTERFYTHPENLTGRRQRVQPLGRILVQPGAEDVVLEERRRQRGALQLLDHVEQRVRAGPPRPDAVPGHGKPAERGRVHGFDLPPEARHRSSAQLAEHVGVARTRARARPGGIPLRARGRAPPAREARR